MAIREELVQVSEVRLHVQRRGQGEPILLIPGLGEGASCWEAQVGQLEQHFACIGYDPRDCGASDLSPRGYRTQDLAEDAVRLLDALDIEHTHVAGWSMGGAVAQELAIGWPDRVKRLALLATYADSDARGSANLRGWGLLRRQLTPADYCRVTAPWVYSPSEFERPGLIEQALERAMGSPQQPHEAFDRQVEATAAHYAGNRLSRIRAPTLLIFGSDDALTPLRFAQALQNGIAHAEMAVLAGAGHALIRTRAQEVSEILERFFSGAGPLLPITPRR
ncbi:MAG: alpha/beta fold hydrolase [Chloroflexota bacterium]|nr:alpha/beta fold hydrolase [Chloroflexota bacterium]